MNRVGKEDFEEHMRGLGRLSHPNLLPLLAYYYRKDEKLLVAYYVPKRSLAMAIHDTRSTETTELDWPRRLRIIRGITKGLNYLYEELQMLNVPHGHLESSNVLLSDSLEPLLTDYALAPVMNQAYASQFMVAFQSPECKQSGKASKKSDIWSFGELILEILTRKLPSAGSKHGDEGIHLAEWVSSVSEEEWSSKVFDGEMGVRTSSEREVAKLLKMGLACCGEDVEKRYEMEEVLDEIEELREEDDRRLSMIKSKLPKPRIPSPPPPPPPPDSSPSRHRHHRILSLLKQCTSIRCFKQIHAHMLTRAVRKPNDLLARLLLLGDLPYSLLLFSQNPRPNDFSFNIVIRALVTLYSRFPLALEFYLRMLRSGFRPDHYTFPFVLLAAANLQSLHHGLAAHASIFKLALHDVDHVQHSLLTMYARCGQVGLARKLFDEIAVRDSVSWNSMLSGYAKMGCAGEAVELFRSMRSEGLVEPDEVTLVSVLAACGDLGDVSLGMRLEELVGEYGLVLNSFLGSSLIDMYGKCGDLDSARRVFHKLAKKDLVAWNAMITGYAQNGLSDEAIKLFHTMKEKGIEPDKITIASVLSACASVGALELGMSLDAYASRTDLYNNVYVGTALVDMYAKCGNLGRAMEVFENLPHRNLFTWNAIISAFAFNGQGEESISLFSRMLADKQGLLPDDITFIGILSACVHSGLVDEGRRWFGLMQSTYGIVPKIEHYSCMVDLFARAGLLEEAWEFLEKMPQKPDAVALGAMLSACRYHKNAKIGEKIAKRILELEPSNSGNYVISSKMFAGSKRWKDSARMIGLMRERGVAKTPGCSWIEVGDQVHEFHAGDGLHLSATEIFYMIDLVVDEMKMEGYTPKID